MIFELVPLRFAFVAREPIYFPAGKSANILRGAFGTIFRRIACLPHCDGASSCEQRAQCPYARLFEPVAMEPGPSGLADHPRPFVFRAMHLDGRSFAPGESFEFDLNLFDTDPTAIAYLILTFAQLARDGLGANRSKVELVSVRQSGKIIYEDGFILKQAEIPPLALDLSATSETVSHIRVRFVTPTELKSGQRLAERPEFAILACRTRDRISTLRGLYGAGGLDLDFRGFGERAAMVKAAHGAIQEVEVQRRSSRTGQVHSIGGFVGEVEYEGDLGEFVPYLRVAKWTGVGRQTVWGKGEIWVEVIG